MRAAFRFGVIASVGLAVSGCGTVRQAAVADISRSGGAVGYFADAALPAQSKSVQLYRAVVIATLISRVAADSLRDDTDIESFSKYLSKFSADVSTANSYLSAEAASKCDLSSSSVPVDSATRCRVWFEYNMPKIEADLVKLAELALPDQQLNVVFGDLSTGNWGGAISSLSKVALKDVEVAHEGAADYRSVVELHAQLLKDVYDESGVKAAGDEPKIGDTVQSALEFVRFFDKADSKDHKVWGAYSSDPAKRRKLDQVVSNSINVLYQNINQSCGDLRSRMSVSGAAAFPASLTGGASSGCKIQLSPAAA